MTASVVIGIDVGGTSKGFHAVALQARDIVGRLQTCDPRAVLEWCRQYSPAAIGIDAPCRWASAGSGRAAERALALKQIRAFATPSHELARATPFYRWMLNGAALYEALESAFPLFYGAPSRTSICFETFPHAVACALAGEIVPAKQKSIRRRALLDDIGVNTAKLSNIDYIDAALCAVAARYLSAGRFRTYGEPASGLIVVPKGRASRRRSRH